MKRLILVRHGHYAGNALTEFGRKTIQALAPVLANSVMGQMLLVSSPVPRAKESATILAEYFHVTVNEQKVWAAEGHCSDNDGAYKFISGIAADVDTLVVVTHFPFLESFPAYFGRLTLDVSFPFNGVDYGQARVINCELKTNILVTAPTAESKNKRVSEPSPKPAAHIYGKHTREDAERYVAQLKKVAPNGRLKHVHLFGSIAKHGSGKDIDLVLEVSRKTFRQFVSSCVGPLNGFHPVTMELLPLASMFWLYESPKEARAKYALEAIGVLPQHEDELGNVVPYKDIDILCLPSGWQGETDVNRMLGRAFDFSNDPNMLSHIIDSAIELC